MSAQPQKKAIVKLGDYMQPLQSKIQSGWAWEDALIGVVVNALNDDDVSLYHMANTRITAQDFSQIIAGYVWHVMTQRITDGQQVDDYIIAQELAKINQNVTAEQVTDYLLKCMSNGANPAIIDSYLDEIQANAIRVRLLHASDEIKRIVLQDNLAIDELIADVNQAVISVSTDYKSEPMGIASHMSKFEDTLNSRIANRVDGTVSTGIPELDATAPFLNGEVIALVGNPGMGKSTLAGDIMLGQAKACPSDKVIVKITLEMPVDAIIAKLIQKMTGISAQYHHKPHLMIREQISAYYHAIGQLAELPIVMKYKTELRPSQLRSLLYQVKAETGKDIYSVIIDGLWLMTPDEPKRDKDASKNHKLEVKSHDLMHTGLTMPLTHIADEFNVPILVLHQYNQNANNRADKKPRLGDLAGGTPAQRDLFTVWGMYRPDDVEGVLWLCGLKGRNNNAITGATVELRYNFHFDTYLKV